jgi:urease accessory protein
MVPNPFSRSDTSAGHGEIHLTLLPPSSPSFQTLCYTYPLKLVSSTPHTLKPKQDEVGGGTKDEASEGRPRADEVPLIFLLSYGGGLLPPDHLSLDITLDAYTRLTITTQGSTKIFPSPNHGIVGQPPHVARQDLNVKLGVGSALLLSPDPSQPFRDSNYSQTQIFEVSNEASLCLLDWVSSGRPARNEVWDAGSWKGRNELWQAAERPQSDGPPTRRRLLIRDTVLLTDGPGGRGQGSLKAESLGAFGTLILHGPVFESMGNFFAEEYAAMPRIGGRDWGDKTTTRHQPSTPPSKRTPKDAGHLETMAQKRLSWREDRLKREAEDGVTWTAARVRGLVLVKFAAREVEGLRNWLGLMCEKEGSILTEFGPGGMMSLG